MPRLASLRQPPPLSPSLLLPRVAMPVTDDSVPFAPSEQSPRAQAPEAKRRRTCALKLGVLAGVAATLALAVVVGSAHAADAREGKSVGRRTATELSLSASFTREVEEDVAWVRWTLEAEAYTPAAAQRELAAKLGKLGALLQPQAAGVRSQTLSVSTEPTYGKPDAGGRPRVAAWQSRAQMRMSSQRSDELLQLSARLASSVPGLRYSGAGFELSLEGRQVAQRALLEPASAELRKRAQATASALGCEDVRLTRIDVGPEGDSPPLATYAARSAVPMMAPDAAPEPTLPLALWPGRQALTLTMRAQAEAQCLAP